MDNHVVQDGLPWIGERIRRFRIDRGLGLTELARRAGISRSYLHELERTRANTPPAPTAGVLFRLARVLGVSIADLVEEEPLRPADVTDEDVPPGLVEAAESLGLSGSDVRQLAGVRFRGRQPQSTERWKLLIQQLELSEVLDEARNGDIDDAR